MNRYTELMTALQAALATFEALALGTSFGNANDDYALVATAVRETHRALETYTGTIDPDSLLAEYDGAAISAFETVLRSSGSAAQMFSDLMNGIGVTLHP